MDQSTKDFNKELALSEIGAWIGAPAVAEGVSRLTYSSILISASAVAGAIGGAAVVWLSMRYRNQKRRNSGYSVKHLAGDIAYFTPIASLIGFLLYDPAVYLISHYLINHDYRVIFSVLASQTVGFLLFISALNAYRLVLHRYTRKRL